MFMHALHIAMHKLDYSLHAMLVELFSFNYINSCRTRIRCLYISCMDSMPRVRLQLAYSECIVYRVHGIDQARSAARSCMVRV